MNNMIKALLKGVGDDWAEIKKEDYTLKNVYVSEDLKIEKAFEVEGEIVAIYSYPEKLNFIEAYDSQMAEIKSILKDSKDWRSVSTINPIKFSYIKNKNAKVYLSVFETNKVASKVSVQFFFEKDEKTIGVFTAVKKQANKSVINTVNNNKVVKEICGLAKLL